MTITINLPPATLDQLKAEAQATGKDIETVVREAVESKLARRKRTFAQILKPVHDDVEACGVSENDIDSLLLAELKAVRDERHATQAEP
jgi:predicted transcriptional regulator